MERPRCRRAPLAFCALFGLLAGSFRADAASFLVTTTVDDNGACLPADCSLREAVLAAHDTSEADLIEVPAGFYQLTQPPDPDTLRGLPSRIGSLQVYGIELEIRALAPGAVVIDAGGLYSVLEISDGAVKLAGLTLQGGIGYTYGGIVSYFSSLEMVRCTVRNNVASHGFGGGLRVTGGQARIFDSSFIGNTALHGGGGIVFQSFGPNDSMLLVNSTLTGNSALGGGGISAQGDGYLEIVHSTIAYNFATGSGAAFSSRIEHASFKNSMIAGNDCAYYMPGTLPLSNGGNLESPGATCFDPGDGDLLSVVNAFLGTLSEQGGSTPSFDLLPASAAIDRAVAADCTPADQRGLARPQGAGCDIGAFELEEAALVAIPALGGLGSALLIGLLLLFGLFRLRSG